jgi:hypothetical protein
MSTDKASKEEEAKKEEREQSVPLAEVQKADQEALVTETSQPFESDRVWGVRWKHMIGMKLFVVAAASGIGWWAYKKWQKHKKEQEIKRQKLWEGHYR